jgi:hypothetical protein
VLHAKKCWMQYFHRKRFTHTYQHKDRVHTYQHKDLHIPIRSNREISFKRAKHRENL